MSELDNSLITLLQAARGDMESEEMAVTVTEGRVDGPVVDLQLTRRVATTTTTAATTEDPSKQALTLKDPFGLVCLQITWTGLSGCD